MYVSSLLAVLAFCHAASTTSIADSFLSASTANSPETSTEPITSIPASLETGSYTAASLAASSSDSAAPAAGTLVASPPGTLHFTLARTNQLPSILQRRLARRWADPTLTTTNQGQWFSVQLKFGSQQTEVTSYIDTGSADLWVTPNLFNPFDSTTLKNTSNIKETCFASGECLSGYEVQDQIHLNDDDMYNANFFIDTSTQNSEHALLGLSWTNYDNFQYTARTSGLVGHVSYSIWLNGAGTGDGSITFGGVDTTKFTGYLGRVKNFSPPYVNDQGEDVYYDPPTGLSTCLNGVSVENEEGDRIDVVTGAALPIGFDTGTTTTSLPRDWIEAIAQAWNCEWNDDVNGAVCDYYPHQGYIIFNFSGVEVKIAASAFADWAFANGQLLVINGTWMWRFVLYDGGEISKYNVMGFGQVFWLHAYVVVDFQQREMAFGEPVAGEVSSSNIESIDASIPSATMGSNYYTSTYHTEYTIHTPSVLYSQY